MQMQESNLGRGEVARSHVYFIWWQFLRGDFPASKWEKIVKNMTFFTSEKGKGHQFGKF